MALYEYFMRDCVFVEKKHVPDGEGGLTTEWVPGTDTFRAAIIKDSSLQARVAEKEGVSSVYTVTTEKTVPLDFHDVIKRLDDGTIFRITTKSKDGDTPSVASFQFTQALAEEWSLPTS